MLLIFVVFPSLEITILDRQQFYFISQDKKNFVLRRDTFKKGYWGWWYFFSSSGHIALYGDICVD